MSKKVERITASEMLKILENQWLSTDDIAKLGAMGQAKALALKKAIIKECEEEKYLLPNNGYVPNIKVVEKLNLDIKYLKKLIRE